MTGLPGRSAVTVIEHPAWVWDGYTGSGDREYPAQLLPGDRCERLADRMDPASRCDQDASWWLWTLVEWHADQQWEALCDGHARSHPHLWRMGRSGDRPYADRYMITMSGGRTAPATSMGHRFWGRLDGRRNKLATPVVDDQPLLFAGAAS